MKPFIPQSLCDRAELLARSHPIETVAELIGVHFGTVYRMKHRGWKAADYSCGRRHVPTDFAIQARDMTVRELAAHYRTSPNIVARWFREKPVRPQFKPGKVREYWKPWEDRA